MKTIFQEIKELFPNPTASTPIACVDLDDNSYCIGGALCRYVNPYSDTLFPTRQDISKALMMVNKNLSPLKVDEFSREIILHNDNGSFNSGWDILKRALEWAPV